MSNIFASFRSMKRRILFPRNQKCIADLWLYVLSPRCIIHRWIHSMSNQIFFNIFSTFFAFILTHNAPFITYWIEIVRLNERKKIQMLCNWKQTNPIHILNPFSTCLDALAWRHVKLERKVKVSWTVQEVNYMI